VVRRVPACTELVLAENREILAGPLITMNAVIVRIVRPSDAVGQRVLESAQHAVRSRDLGVSSLPPVQLVASCLLIRMVGGQHDISAGTGWTAAIELQLPRVGGYPLSRWTVTA
jgi:hypothetical protein